MRDLLMMLLVLGVIFILLVGCSSGADYSMEQLKGEMESGNTVKGKTVEVKVDKVVPNEAFGYVIEAGGNLHFVHQKKPEVDKGDTLTVEVEDYSFMFGEYIITYK